MNDKNLRSIQRYNESLTHEERRELARKAGVASGVARREAATFRNQIKMLLACDVDDNDVKDSLEAMGIEPTYMAAVAYQVLHKALSTGDVEAARFLRDTIGEKPTDALNMRLQPVTGRVQAMDLSKYSDAEIEEMIQMVDQEEAEAKQLEASKENRLALEALADGLEREAES